jgi:hypothetical protein
VSSLVVVCVESKATPRPFSSPASDTSSIDLAPVATLHPESSGGCAKPVPLYATAWRPSASRFPTGHLSRACTCPRCIESNVPTVVHFPQ